jgi:hypothetical protein
VDIEEEQDDEECNTVEREVNVEAPSVSVSLYQQPDFTSNKPPGHFLREEATNDRAQA